MSENGWFEVPTSDLERFEAEVGIAEREREQSPDDMVTEVAALWAAVEVAQRVMVELQLLADFANGEAPEEPCPNDPDGQHHIGCGCEYDWPGGADMVDEVNAMLARIGFEV